MSKSIISRVVWGYGILILIFILMICAFVVNITVDRFNNAQNLMIGEINIRAERLMQTAGEQLVDPSAEKLARLQLLHQELGELLEDQPEIVGSFFLPEQLSRLYLDIRSEFLEDSNSTFSRVQRSDGRDARVLQDYMSGGFRFIQELHDYDFQVERFRGRLVTLLIVLFAVLVLAGTAAVSYTHLRAHET